MIRKKEKTDFSPPRGNLKAMHIEAERCTRGISMLIGGIIGVSDFNDSCVILSSHGGRINIKGKGLSLCVYDNGSVEIVGGIENIELSYGKN